MIDFRYHLVSLVSVFMALAIGVVLGAGPLRDSIGDQLNTQVDGLVRDKSDLQQAVQNREAEIADRDSFIDTVGGSLTASQLGGRDVVVVTLPGSDSGTVDALTEGLTSAGATVTGQVAVNPVWTDPAQAAAREDVAAQLADYLDPDDGPDAPSGGTGSDGGAPADAALAALLAAAVLTPEVALEGGGSETSQAVLDGLGGADLISTDGDPQSLATLAVVVTGAPEDSVGAEDPDWATAATAGYLTLLSALDSASAGVVLAGPAGAAADDGLLARLRSDDDLSTRVTGVDSAETPMGRITTVLAVREELQGRGGQYGYADNASAPVPTSPTGSEPDPSSGDPSSTEPDEPTDTGTGG